MKKQIARITSLAVSVVMTAGLLTGCGSGKSTSGTTTTAASTPESTAAAKKPAYPIATKDKPLTLKVWTGADNVLKYLKDNNEVVAFQEMEKATGVHIEWIHPPIGQMKETFNLLIASRDLPDAICYPWGNSDFIPGGAQKYEKDGIIIPINDQLKYAPNFSKILSDNPEIKKRLSDDNGKIYYFSLMNLDQIARTYNGYMIRQDWLDKAGVKMPANTDELYSVFKAFQEKDVNGSGKKDEYWSATGPDKGIQPLGTLLWAFGTTGSYAQDNGKVTHDAFKPETKEALAYLAKLYAEGLIDPEYMLNDETKLQQKFMNENAGASYGSAGRVLSYTGKITPKNPNAKLVPIPSLKGPGGRKATWAEGNTTALTNVGICLAITTANKHVAETMAWQDWIYTKEGDMAFNFGKEGDTYVMENGQPKFTEKITKDPKGRSQFEMISITATGGSSWPILTGLAATKLQKTEVEWNAYETWGKNMPDNSRIMPPATFNDAELEVMKSKKPAIDDYTKQMFDKFVMGKEPLENYDSVYLAKLKQLGIDDVVKAYQTALDRYNKR